MDSSDTDKGISEVMARSLRLDSPPQRNERENVHHGRRTESGHSNKQARGLQQDGSKHGDSGDSNSVKIDLSDPEQVINMLETVDLSEEDTEVLLQEAYSMNKKLKELLRRQEQGPSAAGGKGTKHKTSDGGSQSKSSSGSVLGSRTGSASAPRNPLPPIKKEQPSIYAVKLKRSRTTVQDASPPRDFSIQRSKTKDVMGISRTKPLARAKTTEPRPEWNDRFNYT